MLESTPLDAAQGRPIGDKPLMTLNKAPKSVDNAIPNGYVILQLATEESINLAIVRPRQLPQTA
jgi:hypothetical protein